MASQDAKFCPFCGKPRGDDDARCPSCGGPSIRSVLAEGGVADPVGYFGEDVATLLYDDPAQGGDGRYYVNPAKANVKWQYLTAQLTNAFPFTLAGNAERKVTIKIKPEAGYSGDTEVDALMMTRTGRTAVRIFVPVLDKWLSNVLIPDVCCFGTSQLQALLASTIYALPDFDWTMDIREMTGSSNTVSPVLHARRFLEGPSGKKADAARRAAGMSRFIHPYWLGPTTAWNNTTNAAVSPDPYVTIGASQSVTVTYSVPSDAYFDMRWILDDSSSSTGVEINDLFVQRFTEGGTGRSLIQVPSGSNGLSLRAFVASPTVTVTGFPAGGIIRAASLPSPAGCWSHLFQPGCDIQITYLSTDAGTITLRTVLAGNLIYADMLPEEACA